MVFVCYEREYMDRRKTSSTCHNLISILVLHCKHVATMAIYFGCMVLNSLVFGALIVKAIIILLLLTAEILYFFIIYLVYSLKSIVKLDYVVICRTFSNIELGQSYLTLKIAKIAN